MRILRSILPVVAAACTGDAPAPDVPVARRDMPALVFNLPSHRHGFDARGDNDASQRVIRETIAFITRQLDPAAR